jgi:hypothetical protein
MVETNEIIVYRRNGYLKHFLDKAGGRSARDWFKLLICIVFDYLDDELSEGRV